MLDLDDPSKATLLGFLFRDDALPGRLLEVGAGMSVLYGLNGAGKSRTLDDIARFFRGQRSPAIALIRLASSPGHIDWNRETEAGDWYPDWARRARTDHEAHVDILRAWVEACVSADAVTMPEVPSTSAVHARDRLDALIAEWMKDPAILVRAHGHDRERRWISAPAFVASPSSPSTCAEVELFEAYDRLDFAEHDGYGEIALTPYGYDAQGQIIACASNYGQAVLEDVQIDFSAGVHDRLIDLTLTISTSLEDIDVQTERHLQGHVPTHVQVRDGQAYPSDELAAHVEALETLANQHYLSVLQEAPLLRLFVDPVGLGPRVQWYVEDDDWPDAARVPQRSTMTREELGHARDVAGLSTAQRRWARWSIEMALLSTLRTVMSPQVPRRRYLFLLDEPEAALHRSAEAQMAAYLSRLADSPDTSLLLSTHSPELLDTMSARVYEVRREQGRRRLNALDAVTRENLASLGLQPSDLLRRQRGLILVEGLHDELIVEQLFGEEMQRLRVETLPLRGTTELSPARIAFLFDNTPAHVFLLLDNIKTSELSAVWTEAVELHRAGRLSKAEALLNGAGCLSSDEGKKLRKVLVEIVLNKDPSRVTPHGLSCADIVEYLPVHELVATDKTWKELRSTHTELRATSQGKTPRDFKTWLTQALSANFTSDNVRRAASELDSPPPDLLRMWKTIEAVLSRP